MSLFLPSRTCPSEGDLTALRAQCSAAKELSRTLADGDIVSAGRVYAELSQLPGNLLCLLHSPEGWVALAEYVAAQLGSSATDLKVTLH